MSSCQDALFPGRDDEPVKAVKKRKIEPMVIARIEDGCAHLGAVTISDLGVLEFVVSDPQGVRSSVRLLLDKSYAEDGGSSWQALAVRVKKTLCVFLERYWEVTSKRLEKGEPSL